jgi:hypothetical protein
MATEKKTVWITLDTQLYWSQLFEQNRDKGEMHEETDGVCKTTLRLTEAQVEELKSLGVPEQALGYQTFKQTTIEDDTFTSYVVKRPWKSKYLKDPNTGEAQMMGAPLVFDYNTAVEAWKAAAGTGWLKDEYKTPWTVEDGLIGNGTTAKVKLSIYRGKNKAGKPTCVVQLEEVAIVDLVEFTGSNSDGSVRF